MKVKQITRLGMILSFVAAGLITQWHLMAYGPCYKEDLPYTCMGEGQSPIPSPPGPVGWQLYTCYGNSEGILERCWDAENEPDGGYCVSVWRTCAWTVWLDCSEYEPPEPPSTPWDESRNVQTSVSAGVPGNCGS